MSHIYIYIRVRQHVLQLKNPKNVKVPSFIKYLPFLFIKHFKTSSRLFNYDSKKSQICHCVFTTGDYTNV